MKIFVGFGYNPNDAWIKESIFTLIQSFEGEVVTGEDIYGEVLTEGVKNRIRESDALLAFLTPRDQKVNGKFTTHDWVRDEYIYALEKQKASLAFLEAKIDWNDGMAGNRQYIKYMEEEKDKLLAELSKVLSKWRQVYVSKRLRFIAPDFTSQVRPLITQGKVKCTYKYMIGSWESPEFDAPLIRIAGGICVDLKNLPSSNGMVQVKVIADQSVWTSDYESLEFLSINLSKEQ